MRLKLSSSAPVGVVVGLKLDICSAYLVLVEVVLNHVLIM